MSHNRVGGKSVAPTTRSASPGTSALLLLDLQHDFVRAHGRMAVKTIRGDRFLFLANKLIWHFTDCGEPVLLAGSEFRRTDLVGNVSRRFAAMKGSMGAEIDARLDRADCLYFPKSKSDAFSNRGVDEYLWQRGVSHLYLGGVYTEYSVRSSGLSAISRGFHVTVIRDAVSSNDLLAHYTALEDLRTRGAVIIDSPEILASRPSVAA